jgi:hypothetical protein
LIQEKIFEYWIYKITIIYHCLVLQISIVCLFSLGILDKRQLYLIKVLIKLMLVLTGIINLMINLVLS